MHGKKIQNGTFKLTLFRNQIVASFGNKKIKGMGGLIGGEENLLFGSILVFRGSGIW